MKPKVVIVLGPTAVGKSEVALALAESLNGEIINADSQQVYRYMDIGTGNEKNILTTHVAKENIINLMSNSAISYQLADWIARFESDVSNLIEIFNGNLLGFVNKFLKITT